MSTAFTPYINFIDDAREAMTFYGSVFGAEPQFMTFGEANQAGGAGGGEFADRIMHSSLFVGPGQHIMASDSMPGHEAAESAGRIQIAVSSDGAEPDAEQRLTAWFEALSDGADVLQPLTAAPWGDTFGMLVDRYGIRWMFSIPASEQAEPSNLP